MSASPETPARILVAGTGGGSGKTLLSLALARAFVRSGIAVQGFKKGPDYIDAAWLSWACGRPARNLDTYLMGEAVCAAAFARHAPRDGLSLIEGNRGLYDGMDAQGTHSSAALARLLDTPVLLVLPVQKVTATAAALLLGLKAMDPEVRWAGVVLNHAAGARHERVIREAVRRWTGLEVLGAIRAFEDHGLFPERHLGLVPLHETRDLDRLGARLDEVASDLDLERILAAARAAGPLQPRESPPAVPASGTRDPGPRVRIAVLRDAAFSFYYPENLEALEAAGADLVFVSALVDARLPEAHAIVIGGGFPETHAETLSANRAMLGAVLKAARAGVPIYAECGGLMYLSRSLTWNGRTWPMAGVLPVDVSVHASPRGHGYAQAVVDRANPFFEVGTRLRAHEFHYSAVESGEVETAFEIERGSGAFPGRDGLLANQVLATYLHVHALGTPEWAPGLVRAAARFARSLVTAR